MQCGKTDESKMLENFGKFSFKLLKACTCILTNQKNGKNLHAIPYWVAGG